MKLFRFLVGLILVVLLQVLGVHFFSRFTLITDLFLILVVYHSLDNSPAWSSIGGSVAGLIQDVLSGGLYGLHGFANTLVAYISCRLKLRLVIQQPQQVGLLFALAAALQLAILAGLQVLLVGGAELPGPWVMLARTVTCGLGGTLLFALAGKARQVEGRWRAKRRRRLKI